MMTDDERWPDGWETHLCPNALDEQGNMKFATHSIHFHQEAKQLKEITDEELATRENRLRWVGPISNLDVLRLIAALRASQSREVELVQALKLAEQECDEIVVEAKATEAALQAEITWLKEHW